MEFEIEKCVLVNIQIDKVIRTEGIQMPDGNNIKDIDETGYEYLGIIEGEGITPGDEGEDQKGIFKETESNTKVKTQLWKYCESHKLIGSTSNQVKCRRS